MQTQKDDIRRFLFLELANNQRLLSCLTGEQLRARTQSPSKNYRVSPVYPVLPKEAKTPAAKSRFFVGFFCFEDPAFVLGRILGKVPKSVHAGLWFSHGLASIIVFANEEEDLAPVTAAVPEKLRAMEIWEVKEEHVNTRAPVLQPSAAIDKLVFAIRSPLKLDSETQILVNELRHCLNTAVARAAQFLPSSLKTFERLYPAVNDIIGELEGLETTQQDAVYVAPSGGYADPLLAHEKRKQQLIDQLIQINSALSYVISQAYAGIPPIIEHECQIRKYSLLGIGSAHNGMAALTESCELTFQRFPIDVVVKKDLKKAPGFQFEFTGSETPTEWNDERFSVNFYVSDTGAQQVKLNLAYFSGRLGFRETQFTVTAPLQTLTHSGTARWSLMTLTHELMHAHVRAILAALFASLQESDPQKAFEKLYLEFSKKRSEASLPKDLRQTLQFVLFNYGYHKPSVDEAAAKLTADGTGGEITANIRAVTTQGFATRLQAYYREINEILVHVLDFNYFYDCTEEPYLVLLWHSWSPVAAVLEHVDEYLLRSVLAISARTIGKSAARFAQAEEKLASVLDELKARAPADPLFSHARARLANPIARKQLLSKFCLGIYLVDMAQKALVCKHIYSALYADRLRAKHGLKHLYGLETCSFDPVLISSPVAFISDLLRREWDKETNACPEDYVSAWVFLVCASAPIEKDKNV
jgi:hypothetical protein